MKKLFLLILALGTTIQGFSQITYEQTYQIQYGMDGPYLINLGNTSYKWVIIDFYHDNFNLYNIDHSPFMLNIPIALSTDSGKKYSMGYITSTLFDCDSTNIEYAIMSNGPNDTLKFSIYRTDGTLIFSKDSVTVPWCYGCNVGSIVWNGITNTNAGAKLELFNGQNQFFIYGLCGSLPEEDVIELNNVKGFVNVFPVPSSDRIRFSIIPPSNLEEYSLIISNAEFQTIKIISVKGQSDIDMNDQLFSSGNYFYSLQNKNKIFQSGKFIISK